MFLYDALRPEPLNPIAFEIFNVEVRWYAICILSGIILAAIVSYFFTFKPLGFTSDLFLEALALGVLFGVLGGRLYYVLFEHSNIDSIWEALNPRNGGMAIHGALYAVAIYIIIYSKVRKLKLLSLLEIVFPAILICQAIGRVGNFMNQEAFGPLVNFGSNVNMTSFGLTDAGLEFQRNVLRSRLIPNFIIDQMYIRPSINSNATIAGYYEPTFLYEAVFNLLAAAIIYSLRRLFKKKIWVGDSACFYLICYGIIRFFIEGLRTDPLMIGTIKVARLTSILFMSAGVILFTLRHIFKFKPITVEEALFKKESTLLKEPQKETLSE